MDQTAQAAQEIAHFLQVFTSNSALRLRFRVKVRGARPVGQGASEASRHSEELPPVATLPAEEALRDLYVEFTGPDTPVLTARNGEVLHALEYIATQILGLEPSEHDQVTFDADHFKANRNREMQENAAAAIERVRQTGRPHSFPPMSSRERRTLHLLLSESGLPTASSGEGPGRFVVLYPQGADTSRPFETRQPQRRDSSRVREAFRHR